MAVNPPELNRPIVAIDFPFDTSGWLGGVNAIGHLLSAYRKLPDPRLHLVLVAPTNLPDRVTEAVADVEIWHTSLLDRSSFVHQLRRLVRKVSGRDLMMEWWLRRRGVSVYSHGEPLGHGAKLPVLGHIADLGTHHFPAWYPGAEAKMDFLRRYALGVDHLLLISHSVERDFDHFHGATGARRTVIHIVPEVAPADALAERDARRRYGLEGRYFFLPNKFWVHKNHRIVIEALGLLKQRGVDIIVACSGMAFDERAPNHFDELMKRASALGVSDRFVVLGIIPATDLASLMRGAVAIINPSTFEGWGLSVAEAREMGKQIILSDIPVFREHELEQSFYFDPNDAEKLAMIMEQLWVDHNPDADRARQVMAAESHVDRQVAYARQYEELILSMIAEGVSRT